MGDETVFEVDHCCTGALRNCADARVAWARSMTDAEECMVQRTAPRSSTLRTAVNITKCFVGAASFELPRAFSHGGTVGSVVGVCMLAALASFSFRKLCACSDLARGIDPAPATYPSLGYLACGWWGWALAWFGTLAMTLGVCGSYFVFISSTMASISHVSSSTWLL